MNQRFPENKDLTLFNYDIKLNLLQLLIIELKYMFSRVLESEFLFLNIKIYVFLKQPGYFNANRLRNSLTGES